MSEQSNELELITRTGMVNVGDVVYFNLLGKANKATVDIVLNPGTENEEIVYSRRRNYYFITSMVIDGKSTHKDVYVEPSEVTKAIRAPLLARIAELEAKVASVDELAQAMQANVRAYCHKETGNIKYVLASDKDNFDDYETVIVIPDVSNAAIDAAIRGNE